MRVSAQLGADVSIMTSMGPPGASLALSPDGSVLVFVGQTGTATQLYARRLDQLTAIPIAGTTGARDPFFSPDGNSLGFFAENKLKRVDLTGGLATAIADAPNDRGGAWGEDGNIVYMPVAASGPLIRVSVAIGTSGAATKLVGGEITHRWPQILPGAKAIMYTAHSAANSLDAANIVVQPLPTGEPKVVHKGGYHARVLPSGHLVFVQEGALFAAPFDFDRLEVTGRPVRVVDGIVANSGTGGAHYAVSMTGRLVYLAGEAGNFAQPITWVDRKGTTTPLRATPSVWGNPSFSPNGRFLAIDVPDRADIWLIDLARDVQNKLPLTPALQRKPVWTPDSARIAYSSTFRSKALNLFWIRADGSTAEPERLTESSNPQFAGSWHPNGRILAFFENRPETGDDLMTVQIDGDESTGWKIGQPKVFLATTSNESEPKFSPDGNWIAYQSSQGTTIDVYVRPFPGPGGVSVISAAGGMQPVWSSRSRSELLYRRADQRVMVVKYSIDGPSFQPEKPRPWSDPPVLMLQRPGQRAFDLHPDDERIAGAITRDSELVRADTVVIEEHFFDELKRRVPPN
jgi:Tol biopolymer transport system component